MGAKNYQDLIAWQKAMDLVEMVYEITKAFPKEEVYALTAQLHRAAISIPSNIAEGQGRKSKKEFHHFLSIGHGSLREVETQMLIANRLQYITQDRLDQLMELAGETGLLINGLMNSLAAK